MNLEVVDDFGRLLEFQSEWTSFAPKIERLTPFQMPEWLITWWRHFGSGQLHVLVFREAGVLAGVIPCFLHSWNGSRQMTLIGSGISDYPEPVLAPQHSAEIVDRLRMHLESNVDWDICKWHDLWLDTPLKQIALGEKLQGQVSEAEPCKLLTLADDFESYWRARSKSLRQNVRRDKQKTELLGRLSFEVAMHADTDAVRTLIALHAARWKKHGYDGTIEANHSARFLEDVAGEFAKSNVLRLFYLWLNGKIAAAIFGFESRKTIYDYVTAFDPDYEALGVGRTLLFESIRYAFTNGCSAWDFMRGDEPYKTWWGAETVAKCHITVTRRG